MKTPLLRILSRLGLASLALSGLVSCIAYDSYGYSPGYYDDGYYSETYYRPASSYGSSYYYRSGHRCSICGYDPCRCSHRSSSHHHDDDDDDRKIKLFGGSQRGKPDRPEGWHSVDWYKSRGYNLKNYSYKDDDGDVHRSGGSKKKDDEHKDNHKKH